MTLSPLTSATVMVRKLIRDAKGVAAIEMAFIFPVMVILYLGLVDITNFLQVNRRVTLTASTLADLVTQADSTITTADIDGIFESRPGDLRTVLVEGISLNLWDFRMQDGGTHENMGIYQRQQLRGRAHGREDMESLMEDGNDIVVARVCYQQDAIIGTMFGSGTIQLDDELMLRPRQSTTLDCTDCP